MKKSSFLLLALLSTSVVAQDDLPEVESLLPTPGYSEPSQSTYNDVSAAVDDSEAMLLGWFERVNALQEQVQILTGKIEEQEFRLSQLQAQYQRELERVSKLMDNVKETAVKQPTFTEVPTERPVAPQAAIEFEQPARVEGEVYQAGYRHLQAKRYAQAKSDFNEVIEKHPEGQFSPNAHYWLGEIHLLQEQYDKAQASFKAVTDKFATHPKAADALLKLGFVAIRLEDWVTAKNYLNEVKQKFPNTVAARLAENQLNQLVSNES